MIDPKIYQYQNIQSYVMNMKNQLFNFTICFLILFSSQLLSKFSSLLLIKPKNEYFNLKNPKNLEHITNIFFNQRRKKIKKPLAILFKNAEEISKKLNINVNDRPQNLSSLKYFEICKQFENLNS